MTILFAGGEPDCLDLVGILNTSTAYRRNNMGRVSMELYNASSNDNITLRFPARDHFFFQFWIYYAGSLTVTEREHIFFRNGTGTVLQLRASGSAGYWKLRNNVGGVWTDLNQSSMLAGRINTALQKLTGEIRMHATDGLLRLWINDALSMEATGLDTIGDSGHGTLDGLRLYPGGHTQRSYISEIIVSEENPRSFALYTRPPTGDGAATDWLGGHANISSASADPMLAAVASNAADQDYLFTKDALSTGNAVRAVAFAHLSQRDTGGPQGLRLLQRHGGIIYPTAVQPLEVAGQPEQTVLLAPPSGQAAWTEAIFNDSQFGFRSVA